MFITADDGLVKLIFSFPTLELSTMGIVEYCRLLLPKIFTFRNIFTFHYGVSYVFSFCVKIYAYQKKKKLNEKHL